MSTHCFPSVLEWQAAYARVPGAVVDVVSNLVETHTAVLAAAFYKDLLTQEGVTPLISAELLQNRLLPSVQRWMLFLFDPANVTSPSPSIALQRHVGEMHARVGVPLALIGFGFRGFKRCMSDVLMKANLDSDLTLRASLYVGEVIDLAMAEMSVAQARAQPLPAAAQAQRGLAYGRHKPLVALGEEESRFLQSVLSVVASAQVSALGPSAFGQWLQHEAPLLFADPAQLAVLQGIQQTLSRLDQDVLPRLQATLPATGVTMRSEGAENLHALLRDVVAGLEDIKAQVNALFDALAATEGYRDALTQLFNRPLLTTLLRREMGLARRKHSTFSVLLVDIDHFSDVNRQYGHTVGNRVLQHVATLLATQVRASDFVFRYGGEEFLLLLVDLDAAQSQAVAEKIRRTVESADIPLPEGGRVQVTLSLGVATYSGQTEPDNLTALADQALGRAKDGGRNRVCVAPETAG